MEYKVYSSTEYELVAPITAILCKGEFECIGVSSKVTPSLRSSL